MKKLATCSAGTLLLLSMTVHETMATSHDHQHQATIVQPSSPEVEYLAAALAAAEDEVAMENDNAVESATDIVAAGRQLYGRRNSKDSRSSGRRKNSGGRVRKNSGGRWGGRGYGRKNGKSRKNKWGKGRGGKNKWGSSSSSSWSSGKSGKSKGSKSSSSSSWDGPSRSGWDHAPVWDAPADWGGDAWDGISGWKDPTMSP